MKQEKGGKPKIRSIRTKITLLAIVIAVITVLVSTLIGAVSIKRLGDSNAEQQLSLLCETGKKNLDSYFESVEQSVTTVSDLVMEDLAQTELADLAAHTERVRGFFGKAAYQTHGVLTYYYRLDPEVAGDAVGFWYIKSDDEGFTEHAVTPLDEYDLTTTEDPGIVWFTVPKITGKTIWLPPYVTENLDARVISYNTPVYKGDTFVGVVGIEIDYSIMAREVDSIELYRDGYAFINDKEGNIIYHPLIDVTVMSDEEKPKVPEGLLSENDHVRYSFDGVEKQAVWMELHNGMHLNVTVPVSEINDGWQRVILVNALVSVVLLLLFVALTLRLTGRITEPLRQLTEAAEQVDEGDYNVVLHYTSNDEVGILSRTFDKLISHLRIYISDLSSMAHTDALTAVRNKGSYDMALRELQQKIRDPEQAAEFAIAIFDCDDLKLINDCYGHDKGDLYLKNTSAMICHVFQNSPVFRIGGDEFAVIMEGDDLKKRDELARFFEKRSAETCVDENPWWEQVRVSMGVAVYDPQEDSSADDVSRRADKLMYENKHARKAGHK